jgi:hypothetical protein
MRQLNARVRPQRRWPLVGAAAMAVTGYAVEIGGATNYIVARALFAIAVCLGLWWVFTEPRWRDKTSNVRAFIYVICVFVGLALTLISWEYLAPKPLPKPDIATVVKDAVVDAFVGPASIAFTDQKVVRFRHGLKTRAPHLECFDSKGADLHTWYGPKVIDEDTIVYNWSKPVTGTCTATITANRP